MGTIDMILKKHTKILDNEETIRETYIIDTDIEIGIQQTKDSIYMYAYNSKLDRNIAIKTNFKKLYNGFKKVAKDGYISKNKGYSYNFTLIDAKKDDVKLIETIEEGPKELSDVDQLKLYILELENTVHKLKNENEDLKEKLNKNTSNNPRNSGRKQKFTDDEIESIKMYKIQGKSIREIAALYKCSVGLVHKLINEK